MNSEMQQTGPRKRRYRSEVREAQKEETRQRILDALIDRLVQGNFSDLTMDKVAEAAGVGPATLYRYFPNREALWDGLSNEFNRLAGSSYPQTADEIPEIIQHDFAVFDRHPGLVQAFLTTELGRNSRSRGRARRLDAIQNSLIRRDRRARRVRGGRR